MHPTAFGKYQVVELIGEGGFGRVFKGLDPDLKRPVAIKTCSLGEPEMRERFFREAEIAARLSHPNITTVFDFGREEGEPYLVQEYLTGRDLDDVITGDNQIPLTTKIEYLIQVGEGLAHAHAHGVVHRDVKPANIRILDDGQVRIMDFGIARLVEETQRFTQAGMSIGTAGYLSPEQLQGLDVDHRSDIFSFGVLAYESVPDPEIVETSDVIVRTRAAGLCGSDLHPYFGRERGIEPGTVMGHEVVGEVVEVGADVRSLSVGDRVVAPFTTSCGVCFYCRTGLTARCEQGQLFGWIQDGAGLHGCQAEAVRVPLADGTLVGDADYGPCRERAAWITPSW